MTKSLKNQDCNEKQKNLWQVLDKDKLTQVLTILINGQKTYGKDYSLADTFAYYKFKLENRFSIEQIIYAIDKYTDFKNDIPAPADIISILSPEKPKVTEAQYVNACKYQELNGYSKFSPEAYVIKDYHKQNDKSKEQFILKNNKIMEIAKGSVKMIN